MDLKIAGLSGAAAVALGAYGAHGLKNASPQFIEIWKTANAYHFVHSTVLLFNALHFNGQKRRVVAGLLGTGILLFSGSCYTVGLLQDRGYGRLAPFGGMAFIGGWLAIAFL